MDLKPYHREMPVVIFADSARIAQKEVKIFTLTGMTI